MWLKYVGSQTKGGITQDCEHEKYYWGPDNNWTCEVPDRLGIEIMKSFGEAYQVVLPPTPPPVTPPPADESKKEPPAKADVADKPPAAKAPGDDGKPSKPKKHRKKKK